jgi:hypothetical protein
LGKLALAAPLSHSSLPLTRPSPQIGLHTDGAPAQVKPVSTVHAAEQPSPAMVFASSHVSGAMMTPSPQIGLHTDG